MGRKSLSGVGWQALKQYHLVFLMTLAGLMSPLMGYADEYSNRCIQSVAPSVLKDWTCKLGIPKITPYYWLNNQHPDKSPSLVYQKALSHRNARYQQKCAEGGGWECDMTAIPYPNLDLSETVNVRNAKEGTVYFHANSPFRILYSSGKPPDDVNAWIVATGQCSAGWKAYPSPNSKPPGFCACQISSGTCDTPPPKPPKRPKDPPNPCPSTPNPIAIGAGNKWLIEHDITSPQPVVGLDLQIGLNFQRYYSSARYQDLAHIGTAWTHTFSAGIQPLTSNLVRVTRPDGRELVFVLSAGKWMSDADISDKLTEVKSGTTRIGWLYTVSNTGVDETYNAAGQLLQLQNRAGLVQTLTYNDLNQLTQVTNSLGQSLSFNYDAANRISQVINLAGGVIGYGYDATGNLTSVTYPDGNTKTYHYGADVAEAANVAGNPSTGVSYESSLTGITDENNVRTASYRYDAEGRAYEEEHAPSLSLGINHHSLAYNMGSDDVPISTVVTDPLGTQRVYTFTTVLDVVKNTGQSQPAGSGCAASASAITYDANGNVAARTDFTGHQTTYKYDLARNLETSRTEGLDANGAATAATRTITTTWHATWHLPLVITEYNGGIATGTALKQTTYGYDAKGNLTSLTETDPARALNRTTTITYTYSTELPGLVLSKVVNGSRTDVTDSTTYTYYPHNAVCASGTDVNANNNPNPAPDNLGCRGQLQSITNALGHTITYDRYHPHGQVAQITDANGVVTTTGYDARQRLTAKSISSPNTGTQTTGLSYDNAGQLTQLKLPDNSVLNYFYDAAHRLTDVQDTLGNTVHYTLDAAGNRIAESTTDPQGNLANTITRSFDALNRLKTVTGVE